MTHTKPHLPGTLFVGLSAMFALSACLPLPGADGRIAHLPILCPFRTLTGLPCPACGLTRAFVCLSHGRVEQSLHWHPIGWLVYGVLLLLWARAGLSSLFGKPILPLSERSVRRLCWFGASVFLLVGFGRIGLILVHPSLRMP
jgi:hypothetical protein